jgi:hypothetical protein
MPATLRYTPTRSEVSGSATRQLSFTIVFVGKPLHPAQLQIANPYLAGGVAGPDAQTVTQVEVFAATFCRRRFHEDTELTDARRSRLGRLPNVK